MAEVKCKICGMLSTVKKEMQEHMKKMYPMPASKNLRIKTLIS